MGREISTCSTRSYENGIPSLFTHMHMHVQTNECACIGTCTPLHMNTQYSSVPSPFLVLMWASILTRLSRPGIASAERLGQHLLTG